MTQKAKNLIVHILERYHEVNQRVLCFNTYHYLLHGEDEQVMNELSNNRYIRIIEKDGQTIYKIYLEDSFYQYFNTEIPE